MAESWERNNIGRGPENADINKTEEPKTNPGEPTDWEDEYERKQTIPNDPVLKLFPLLRSLRHRPQFDQAVKDLEHLELARYFPDRVPGRDEIITRFRAFLENLPEPKEKEQATAQLEKLLKQIKKNR